MSSEKRLVRPYEGVNAFQQILSAAHVMVGGRRAEAEQRVTIPSNSFLHDPVVIVLADDDEDLEKKRRTALDAAQSIGLEGSDVEFLVLASTPYLRLLDIAHRARLDQPGALARTITLQGSDDGVRALRTPAGGCDIELVFCLASEQPRRPLRPHRLGTWLGRTRFRLRTDLGELGFTPRPLTRAKRTELGLPEETIRYVEVEPSALLQEDVGSAVELYVDDELLSHLSLSPGTTGARSVQRQLFLDVVAAIVRAAQRLDDLDDIQLADIEDTVLHRIVDLAALHSPGETTSEAKERREKALALLKNDPEMFVARIESTASPRKDLIAVVKGVDE